MMNKIKDNLFDLYSLVQQHKALYEYYQKHKSIKSELEIQQRIDYILKNKIKQKDEVSTLLWVIGKDKKELLE